MTVGTLKMLLDTFPDDLNVVMSRDSEGNEFRPLSKITNDCYEADGKWWGHLKDPEDVRADDTLSVVLWPIN